MNGGRCFGAGSAMLALIFSILCLTVSALTTLSSASRDRALAERVCGGVRSYHSADCLAVETAAALSEEISNGEAPEKIGEIAIKTENSGQYSFSVPVNENLAITVSLTETDGSLKVNSWVQTRTDEWIPDESLKVWTGESIP
ncbi:MAG: hypothetical protein VB064_13275 [Oscillospiraceae bacterium]|nr:hypothetical protein [Oscillospiraceae bacterium]